jgi:hypothetical protein
VIAVKENQRHLYADMKGRFAHAKAHRYEDCDHSDCRHNDKGHGWM